MASQNFPAQYLFRIYGWKCRHTFGESPCTATGEECYNTRTSCKDTPNHDLRRHAYRFSMNPTPDGKHRDTIEAVEIDTGEVALEGIGSWAKGVVTLRDSDAVDQTEAGNVIASDDPYGRASRSGTYWGRFLARNADFRNFYAEVDIINPELAPRNVLSELERNDEPENFVGGLVQRTRWKIDNIVIRETGKVEVHLASPNRDAFQDKTLPQSDEAFICEYSTTLDLGNGVYVHSSAEYLPLKQGTSKTFQVQLGTLPSPSGSSVTVSLTPSQSDVTVSPSSLTFTSSNGTTPQTVTVSANANAEVRQVDIIMEAVGAQFDSVNDASTQCRIDVYDDESSSGVALRADRRSNILLVAPTNAPEIWTQGTYLRGGREIVRVEKFRAYPDSGENGVYFVECSRAHRGTEAVTHKQGDKFSICTALQGDIASGIREIFLNHTGISVSELDLQSLNDYHARTNPTGQLDGVISKETPVDQVLAEICQIAQAGIIWDIFKQEFTLIGETTWSKPTATIGTHDFESGSFSISRLPDKQITRGRIKHWLADATDDKTYSSTLFFKGNTEELYQTQKEAVIETQLIGGPGKFDGYDTEGQIRPRHTETARTAISRLVQRYQHLPHEVVLDLLESTASNLSLGQICRIEFPSSIQRSDGMPRHLDCMLVSMKFDSESATRQCKFVSIRAARVESQLNEYVITARSKTRFDAEPSEKIEPYRDFNLWDWLGQPSVPQTWRVRSERQTQFYSITDNASGFEFGNFPAGSEIIFEHHGKIFGPGGGGGDVLHPNGRKGYPGIRGRDDHLGDDEEYKFRLINYGEIIAGAGGGGKGADYDQGGVQLDGGRGGRGAMHTATGDPSSQRGGFLGATRPEQTGNPGQTFGAIRAGFAGSGGDPGTAGRDGERAQRNNGSPAPVFSGTPGKGGEPGLVLDIDSKIDFNFTDGSSGAAGANTDENKIDFTFINRGITRGDFNADVEVGAIIVSSDSVSLDEGDEVTITTRLSAQPRDEVSVAVYSNNAGIQPDISLLRFTVTNWHIPQPFRIRALPDSDSDDTTGIIKLTAKGGGYDEASETIAVNVTDTDTSGFIIGLERLTVVEGNPEPVLNTIRLKQRPVSAVVVNLTGGDSSAVTYTPNQLTFSPATWNIDQTVAFLAPRDSDTDSETEIITVASDQLGAAANKTITVNVIDTGTTTPPVTNAALVFTPSPVNVTEGQNANIDIELAVQPSGNVTVFLTRGADDDITTNKATLIFTPSNWNQPQTVQILATHDDDAASETATLYGYAAGGGYDDVVGQVTINITDDDDAAMILSNSTIRITEGFTGDFTVHLNAPPTSGNVTVALTRSNDKVLLPDGDLTFTAANWETPQTVTVTGALDDDSEDDSCLVTLTATGGGIALPPVSVGVTVIDVDKPRFEFDGRYLESDNTCYIEEEAFNFVGIRLATEPTSDVTLTVAVTGDGFSINSTSITFTPTNWHRYTYTTVTSAKDADALDNTGTLTFTAAGAEYDGIAASVRLAQRDTEGAPSILVYDANSVVPVGEQNEPLFDYFQTGEPFRKFIRVRLNKRPTVETVSVTLAVTQTPQFTGQVPAPFTVTPTTLLFTEDNWFTEQRVQVDVGKDTDALDDLVDLDFTASGGNFDGVTRNVKWRIQDSDHIRLNLSRTQVFIPEGTTTNAFSISLPSKPVGDIDVDVVLTLPETGVFTEKRVVRTFTAQNWETPQVFPITAGRDDDDDSQAEVGWVTIEIDTTQQGYVRSAWDDHRPRPIRVIQIDDDVEGFILSPTFLEIDEETSADFTIAVDGTITEDLVLTLAVNEAETSGISLNKTQLTFTPQNSSAPQTVRVTTADDFDDQDDLDFIIITTPPAGQPGGGGADWDGSTAFNYVVGTIDDDDPAGIEIGVYPNRSDDAVPVIQNWINARVARQSQPGGVRLTRAPVGGDPVTVTVTSSNPGVTVLPYLGEGQDLFGNAGGNIFLPTDGNDNRRASEIAADGISAFSQAEGSFYVTDDQGRVIFANDKGETLVASGTDAPVPAGYIPYTQQAAHAAEMVRLAEVAEFFIEDVENQRNALADWQQKATAALKKAAEIERAAGNTVEANEYDKRLATVSLLSGVAGVGSGLSFFLINELDEERHGGNESSDLLSSALFNNSQFFRDLTQAFAAFRVARNRADARAEIKKLFDDLGEQPSEDALEASFESLAAAIEGFNSALDALDAVTQAVDDAARASGVNRNNISSAITPTQARGLTGGGISQRRFEFPSAEFQETRPNGDTVTRAWNAFQKFVIYPIPGTKAGGTATLTFTARGGGYTGQFTQLTVNLLEEDAAGIVLDPPALDVPEGGSATFRARSLSLPPTTVAMNASAITPGFTVTPTSRIVSRQISQDWYTYTVTSAEDSDANNDIGMIQMTITDSGSYVATETVTVTQIDNETRSIISPTASAFTLQENSSYPLTMRLSATPVGGTVTITFATDNPDITFSPSSLSYTAANWNTLQTVNVRATADADQEDDTATITATAAGGDWGSNPGVTRSWTASIIDSTVSPPTLSTTALTITEGGTGTVNIRLAQAPSANATMTFSSTNPDLTTASSVVFTTSNWNVDQAVVIAAADDFDSDNETGVVTLAINGGGYTGESASVSVTITDNDLPAAVVPSVTSLSINEGSSATFTADLAAKPTGDVTVTVASDDVNVTVSPTTLTFNATTWDVPQTVTVQTTDDEDLVGESATITLTAQGGGYSGESATVTVSVLDTDIAAIQFSGASARFVEGQARNLGIRLSHKPASNVSISISGTGFSVSGSPLLFTDTSWDTVQNVSITPAEDLDASDETITVTATAQGTGSGYAGVTGSVNLSVDDKDTRGISFDSDIEIDEDSSGNIGFRLLSQPTASVTVVLSISPANSGLTFTGGTNARTFTTSNYANSQYINFTAGSDPDNTDETYTITATATGGDYDGLTQTATVTVDDSDQDPASIVVNRSQATVREGGSVGVDVRLNNEPSSNVTVSVVASGAATLNLSTTSLTFTPQNYTTNQTVTISSPEDGNVNDETGTVTYSASGGGYSGISATTGITVDDNDSRSINVNRTNVPIAEGGSRSVDISLDSVPTANVTVTPTSTNSDLSFTPASLTFTPSNSFTDQTISVRAAEDSDDLNDSGTITLTASGGDYAGVSRVLTFTIQDNDYVIHNLTLSKSNMSLAEGGNSDTFTVRLDSQPLSDRIVNIATRSQDDSGKLTITPTTLTFTPDNWNTPQTVTVSALQDADVDDETISVDLTGSGVATRTLLVGVTDDDEVRLVRDSVQIIPVIDYQPIRVGVRLDSQPTATVGVRYVNLNINRIAVPSTLVLNFTAQNWETFQYFTLTPTAPANHRETTYLDRMDAGGAAEYVGESISVPYDFDMTTPGLTLSTTTLSLTEGGSSGTFNVRLAENITLNRTINITSDNPDVTVSPTSLTYTPSNWNTYQTVTVTADEDAGVADDTAIISFTGRGTSANTSTVTVSVDDNDTLGINLTRTALTVTEGTTDENRITATTQVTLNSQPTGTVTITPTCPNSDVTFEPATRTFTGENWNTGQTFTAKARRDADLTNESETITFTGSGADYNGVTTTASLTIQERPLRLTFSPVSSLDVDEGGSAAVDVRPDEQPAASRTWTISPTTGLTVSPNSVTFTPDNWQTRQAITVTAATDSDTGDSVGQLNFSGTGVANQSYTVNIEDQTPANIIVSPTSVNIGESRAFNLRVSLSNPPPAGQTATITGSSSDEDVVAFQPDGFGGFLNVVNFTSTNYNIGQNMNLRTPPDADYEDESAIITLTGSGAGSGYAGETVTVNVNVTDPFSGPIYYVPSPGASFNSSYFLPVSAGNSYEFGVRLFEAVDSDLTLSWVVFTEFANAGYTVTPLTTTFTSANWDKPTQHIFTLTIPAGAYVQPSDGRGTTLFMQRGSGRSLQIRARAES